MSSKTLYRTLFVVMLCAFTAACSSNKKKELKPVDLESFDESVEIDHLWTHKVKGDYGDYYQQFTLAVDAIDLYAATADGFVEKLGKLDGDKKWRVDLDTKLTAGVAISTDLVFVAAIDGAVIALDKVSGEQRWSAPLKSEAVAPMAVYQDSLIVQTVDGSVYSLEVATGKQLWRHDSSPPALTLRGSGQPAFFGNYVAVGTAGGKVSVLSLQTGELLGEPRVAEPSGNTEIERLIDVDGSPLIIEGKLYVASYQGQIICLELQTGRILWAEEESSYHPLAEGFSNIYATSDASVVTAYKQAAGDIAWVQEGLLRRKATAPTVVSSYVIVADYKGYMHLLSQVDGSFSARKRVSFSPIKNAILADGSRFYVMATNGRLKAYEIGEEIK